LSSVENQDEVEAIVRGLEAELEKERRRRWVRRIGIAVVLGLGIAGYLAYRKSTAPRPEPRFTVATVEVRDIVEKVQSTGVVEPVSKLEIGSQISGRVARVLVDFNDIVKEGQLLAEIDPELMSAQVRQSQAELDAGRAGIERTRTARSAARIRLERVKTLVPEGVASAAELEQAQADFDIASAEVATAEAQLGQTNARLKSASANLKYTKIFSPIDGVVIDRTVEPGQTVAASFNTPVLFVIARDLEQMRVVAEIDEADIGKVHEGMMADVIVDAFPGQHFSGKLVQIRLSPNTVEGVVTYSAIILLENHEGKLRPGMTATATVETARVNQAVAVRNSALRFEPLPAAGPPGAAPLESKPKVGETGSRVYQVQGPLDAPDAKLEARAIEPGVSDGVYTEAKSGLKTGDAVVVDEKPRDLKRGFRIF